MIDAATRWLFIRPIAFAVLMTVLAKVFCLVVWGLVLFPVGSLAGKAAWTLTCGIAMASVIGAATVALETARLGGARAFWFASIIFFTVSAACALLCIRVNALFNYFGGNENTTLFVHAGVIPAVVGGLLDAWLPYARSDEGGASISI